MKPYLIINRFIRIEQADLIELNRWIPLMQIVFMISSSLLDSKSDAFILFIIVLINHLTLWSFDH